MTDFVSEPQPDHFEEGKHPDYKLDNLPEDHEHDKNLFVKVYDTVLANMAVQNGMKKINKISQPIIDICHDLLDERISDFKHKGQEVLNNTKERLTSWLYNVNIYSHLVGLWIFQNTPHDPKSVKPEEEFLKAFEMIISNKNGGQTNINNPNKVEQDMELCKEFYQIASELWAKLQEPTSEDIKNTLLHAVAKTIGKRVGAKDGFYSGNLVHNFKELVETKKEVVSDDAFIEIVKGMTGNAWLNDQEYRKGTHDFYIFAKRFTLVDLPLIVSTKSVSQALFSYFQELSRRYAEKGLNWIEVYLDTFLMLFGQEFENEQDGTSLIVRSRNVMSKMGTLAKACLDSSTSYATSTRLYITADKYIDFKQRLDDFTVIALTMMNLIDANLYKPTKQFITAKFDQVTKTYTVILQGLNSEVVKEKLALAKEGYEYLKEATFYLKDQLLEIRFTKEHVLQYKDQITEQVLSLYEELKKINSVEKAKEKAQQLYIEAIATLKARRNIKALEAKQLKEKSE
jgi:hypothetical protein